MTSTPPGSERRSPRSPENATASGPSAGSTPSAELAARAAHRSSSRCAERKPGSSTTLRPCTETVTPSSPVSSTETAPPSPKRTISMSSRRWGASNGSCAGATAVLPAHEPLLAPHLRDDIEIVRFGEGGAVSVLETGEEGVTVSVHGRRVVLEPGFRSAHLLEDLCAALAASSALGVEPADGPLAVAFSGPRGDRLSLPGGVLVINDCYNANPMSMRAALQELATTAAGRRVAVLGDMLELGAGYEERYHRELGEQASAAGVELLVTVGPRASWAGESFSGGEHLHTDDAAGAVEALRVQLRPGDTVLVKGSRGVALERIAELLAAA